MARVTLCGTLLTLVGMGCLWGQGQIVPFYSFRGSPDGSEPSSLLLQWIDGSFYGTTWYGGLTDCLLNGEPFYCGTVFRVSGTGEETVLARFNSATMWPSGSLAVGRDGNFYGIALTATSTANCTVSGGLGCGVVFQVTPQGVLSVLPAVIPSAGNNTLGSLVLGNDGGLYGTSFGGGSGVCRFGSTTEPGCGTVFRVGQDGSYSVIANFSYQYPNLLGGAYPNGRLIAGRNGMLYGTTEFGGRGTCKNGGVVFGCGTIFQVTTAGELTTIANFNDSTAGQFPFPPVLLENGTLYGLALQGGANGYGTAFEIGTGGLQVIANFDSTTGQPAPPLLLANDGNLYGTDCGVGNQDGGVFQITPADVLNMVASFAPDGSIGNGCDSDGLIQGTDGNLYGTSEIGGERGGGVVYQVRLGLPPVPPMVASFQPSSGGAGATVEISGQHLIQVKEVAFGGVAAKFKMATPNVLHAVVPQGALSGPLMITTLTGAGQSSQPFTVTP